MSALIRQPSASDDRFPIASVSIVGAIALGVGLWLAHAAMGHPAPQIAEAERTVARESESGEGARESEGASASASASASGSASASASASASESASARTSEGAGASASASGSEGASEGASAPTDRARGSSTPGSTPAPVPPAIPVPSPVLAASAGHVVHGRIAYLRCDGAPQLPGPFPCPRDAALEDAVWAAIDRAAACSPPLPPGQADLVVEFQPSTSAAPSLSTRDTFPDDAIRTDAAGVIACLTPLLASATTTLTGDRIRVGFRFTLE